MNKIIWTCVMANDADEEHHPIRRRGRFIAPTADVSAPVAVPISRLFCETPLSALIGITLSHEERPEATWPVGMTFMVTRRGGECGPVSDMHGPPGSHESPLIDTLSEDSS